MTLSRTSATSSGGGGARCRSASSSGAVPRGRLRADFARALTPPPGGIRLLAEVKKASPSRGVLSERFDPLALAETYARHGAAALSVLTDEKYFQGSLEFLTAIRERVDVPILRKDFTLDEYHLWEARAAGADAVLLIVSILDAAALRDLHAGGRRRSAWPPSSRPTRPRRSTSRSPRARGIIGINNRDLKTFETRIETTLELLPLIPAGRLAVSESGFFTAEQVRTVAAAGAHAVLVGEALVRAPDVAAKVRELALGDPGGQSGPPGSVNHDPRQDLRDHERSPTRAWRSTPAPTRSGFIFVEDTPRFVTPEQVAPIVKRLPPFVTPVGVFWDHPSGHVKAVAEACGLRALQFHGDESPDDLRGYSLSVIKTVKMPPASTLEGLLEYRRRDSSQALAVPEGRVAPSCSTAPRAGARETRASRSSGRWRGRSCRRTASAIPLD